MGLISDRKNKTSKNKDREHAVTGLNGSFHPHTNYHISSGKRKIFGPQVLPNGNQKMVPKYPAGYYTTPVNHRNSASNNKKTSYQHPGQPKYNPNVNPRYQTWVAPRKQPSLGQLVRIEA